MTLRSYEGLGGVTKNRAGPSVELNAFDAETMKLDTTILVVGKRGSGKSTKIKWIMRSIGKRITKGIVIRGVPNDDYTYIPLLFIMNTFDSEFLHRIIYEQTVRRKKWEFLGMRGDPPRMFLILEDYSSDRTAMNDKNLKFIFHNGRHIFITLIIVCQYFKDLPKALRSNVDYLFMLNDKSTENRKSIWKEYMSFIERFADFNAIYDKITANHSALIMRVDQSNSIADCLFQLRISKKDMDEKGRLADFDVGSDNYRQYSKEHYYNEENEQLQMEVQRQLRHENRKERNAERERRIQAGEESMLAVSTIGTDDRSSVLTEALGVDRGDRDEDGGSCGGGDDRMFIRTRDGTAVMVDSTEAAMFLPLQTPPPPPATTPLPYDGAGVGRASPPLAMVGGRAAVPPLLEATRRNHPPPPDDGGAIVYYDEAAAADDNLRDGGVGLGGGGGIIFDDDPRVRRGGGGGVDDVRSQARSF